MRKARNNNSLRKSQTVAHVDNIRKLKESHSKNKDPILYFSPIKTVDKIYNFKLKKISMLAEYNIKCNKNNEDLNKIRYDTKEKEKQSLERQQQKALKEEQQVYINDIITKHQLEKNSEILKQQKAKELLKRRNKHDAELDKVYKKAKSLEAAKYKQLKKFEEKLFQKQFSIKRISQERLKEHHQKFEQK